MKKTLFILALILILTLSTAPFALAATDAAADGEVADQAWWAPYASLMPFLLIIPVFYFMLIRPEKKRKQAAQQLRNDLIVTDEVTTMGGIVGKVVQIKDDQVTIETGGERTRITIQRAAIVSRRETVSN